MKRQYGLLTIIFTLSLNTSYAQDPQSIKQTLLDWNKAIMTKNVERAMAIFDNDANVILVGSEEKEIHRGNSEIRHFLNDFFCEAVSSFLGHGQYNY